MVIATKKLCFGKPKHSFHSPPPPKIRVDIFRRVCFWKKQRMSARMFSIFNVGHHVCLAYVNVCEHVTSMYISMCYNVL